MIKKIPFIAVILILILSSCLTTSGPGASGGNQPAWITDIDSAYPSERYLAVLGQGDSLSQAQAKAASNLALIFESRIIVDTRVETRYAEMKKQGIVTSTTDETRVSDDISQMSDQTLLNVKFGESWTDRMGMVTTAAYIDRLETAELYRSKIADQSDVLIRLKKLGDSSESILERYAYHDSSFAVAMSNEVLLEQLGIISPMTAKISKPLYDLDEIKSARKASSDNLTFSLNFSGENAPVMESAVSDTLTDMGFSVSENGYISAAGNLSFEKIKRNNDYENYKWYLNLEITDETGKTLISLDESGISASTSDSAALSRINVDVGKIIKKELPNQFNSYLGSFIQK